VESLLSESLKFMVLGMGIVFILLAFIVFLTNIQAKIVAQFFPDKSGDTVESAKIPVKSEDGALVAAISVAISLYRKTKG